MIIYHPLAHRAVACLLCISIAIGTALPVQSVSLPHQTQPVDPPSPTTDAPASSLFLPLVRGVGDHPSGQQTATPAASPVLTATPGPTATSTSTPTLTPTPTATATSTPLAPVPPVANDDSYTVEQGEVLILPAPGVLANDVNAGGGPLAAHAVSAPSHGALALQLDGSLHYTPAVDYRGHDAFAYILSSGTLESAPATVAISVTAPASGMLPPDPATVAPVLDRTVATSLYAATQFLYAGNPPLQMGVAQNVIEPNRVAVLRGRVLDRSNAPLPGVTITILDHPEFGYTLSRADGMFDMAVNGGGTLTVNYHKVGFLPSQRHASTRWQQYAWLDDVVLIPLDTQATTVELSGVTTTQVTRGSAVSDADGVRRATLLIPAGTEAELVFPDGSTQELTGLTIRATEYTVGESGRAAMPGDLPPQSGYTYALEYSVDEVATSGASGVRFDRPLYHYVENFLHFPVGSAVPAGYYDRRKAAWIPSENGQIVKVIQVSGGLADLDTDGDGVVDNNPVLGITETERSRLAAMYGAGQELWRVPITHFTPWDFNWPYGPPLGALAPYLPWPLPGDQKLDSEDTEKCNGCIIEAQNQILGEEAEVVGTPFRLHYSSDRMPGRRLSNQIEIPLSGEVIPAGLQRIELEVQVAGQQFQQSFAAVPNQTYDFAWNGRDAYGRILQGQQPVTIRVGYVYNAIYQQARDGFAQSFAAFSGVPISGSRARAEVTLWQETTSPEVVLGQWDVMSLGLGGWSLSAHHVYDPGGRVLYGGDGSRRSTVNLEAAIKTIAGGGAPLDGIGDGAPAVAAQLNFPLSVVAGADGSLYIADAGNNRIRRVTPDGIIATVAGTGVVCDTPPCGDGGPAMEAALNNPTDVALAPDGVLYFTEGGGENSFPFVVRRVGANGTITTVAGGGNPPDGLGDNGPATAAMLSEPRGIAIGPDGSLYIADTYADRIRRVGTDGIIATIAGTGVYGFGGDGGPARSAVLANPAGVAVGLDGSVYIADTGNHRVRRIGWDGVIATVAGDGSHCSTLPCGDGGPAVNAHLWPDDVAVDGDGDLYVSDLGYSRVRKVRQDGRILTIAGSGAYCTGGSCGEGGPATQAALAVGGIAVGPDEAVYLAEVFDHRVRMVHRPLPGFDGTDIAIPSADGTQLYQFDADGRHLRTIDTFTGVTLLTFGYNATGQLNQIADRDGNSTLLNRDANGKLTSVTGPFGRQTMCSLAANGYLTTLTNPAGEATHFGYTADGLLTGKMDGRGLLYQYAYDSAGRLQTEMDPAGGAQTFISSTTLDGGVTVTRSTTLNRTSVFAVAYLSDGSRRQLTTLPDGTQRESLVLQDGTQHTVDPDGTVATVVAGPDPRFGMQVSPPTASTVVMPSGLQQTTLTTRTVALENPSDLFSMDYFTETVTRNGRMYRNVFDATSRTITSSTPAGRLRIGSLDMQGRITSEQVADFMPSSYTYDGRGQLTTITQGDRVTSFSYSPQGDLVAIVDAEGRMYGLSYDAAGRVISQSLPDNRIVGFSFDANGNLTGVTPPGRPIHAFAFTSLNASAAYTPPLASGVGTLASVYSYNLDRQLTGVLRPDGLSIVYGYDGGGRLQTVTMPHGSVDYTYEPTTGQLQRIAAGGIQTLTYAYDGALTTGEVYSGAVTGRIGYTYDNNFRLSSHAVNGESPVGYQYDDDDLLIEAGGITFNRQPQNGLLAGSVIGGISESWSYNAFGEVTGDSVGYLGSQLFAAQHSRDRLGRIVNLVETVLGVTTVYSYTYDLAGRLVDVQQNGLSSASYTYDSNSNRLTGPDGPGVYDNQDRLLQYGAITYGYSANGELQSKAEGGSATTYSYDVLGNLRSVVLPDGMQIRYMIDGQNRRVGRWVDGVPVQGFLYLDAVSPVAELDGSNTVVATFVYGSRSNVPDYMVKGGATYRIIADHRGSPRMVVDVATGVVAQRMDYDAFGRLLLDTNPGFQPFGFAGGLYDHDTGLIRFGARDYDPHTGRWTAKDPILFAGGDVNLYGYVLNDPVNLIDRNGQQSTATRVGAALARNGGEGAGMLVGGMQSLHNMYNYERTLADAAKCYEKGTKGYPYIQAYCTYGLCNYYFSPRREEWFISGRDTEIGQWQVEVMGTKPSAMHAQPTRLPESRPLFKARITNSVE